MKKIILSILLLLPLISISQTSHYCYYKDAQGQFKLYENIKDRDLDGFTKKFTATDGGAKTKLTREQFQSVSFISVVKINKTQSFSAYVQEIKTLKGKGKSEKVNGLKKTPILCSWKGEISPGKMLTSTTTWRVVFSDSSGTNVILKKYSGIVSRSASRKVNSDSITTYIEEKGEIQYALISNNILTYLSGGDKDRRIAALDLIINTFDDYPEAIAIFEKMKSIQSKKVGERSLLQVTYWAELSALYFEKYFVEL